MNDLHNLLDQSLRHVEKYGYALTCLHQAYFIAEKSQSREDLASCHRAYIDFFKHHGDLRKALDHSEKLIAAERKLFSSLRNDKTAGLAERLLDSASDAILTTDDDGILVEWNHGATQVFGYPAQKVLGQPIGQLIPDHLLVTYRRELTRTLSQGSPPTGTIELQGVRSDGEEFPAEVALSWWTTDEGRFYGAILRDITERKRLEGELEQAKDRAESANRSKSQFIATMSHELRTPLNAILGYSQILKNDPTFQSKHRRGVDTIEQSGTHLLGLIDDILDLAKIESGEFHLHNTDFSLHGLLERVGRIISVQARDKKLDYRLLTPVGEVLPHTVSGDEKRLGQILLNLLGNAVKFTHEGDVELRVVAADNRLSFHVRDTGIGIPAEHLDLIFEPYRQIDEDRFNAQGLGLGLAITSRLARAMGGRITVISTVDKGSTFSAEVPLNIVAQRRVTPRRAKKLPHLDLTRDPTPPTALVVDDNRANRSVLMDLLATLGFETIEAAGGYEGLAKAELHLPRVIITDLVMPEMDGYELMQRIRASSLVGDTPIIATSSSVFEADYRRSQRAGSDTFLPKPIHPEQLCVQLSQLLSVNWIYADEGEESATSIPRPDFDDNPLNAEQLQILLESAEDGDIEALMESLSGSEGDDSRFVAELRSLATGFRINEIRHLLQSRLRSL